MIPRTAKPQRPAVRRRSSLSLSLSLPAATGSPGAAATPAASAIDGAPRRLCSETEQTESKRQRRATATARNSARLVVDGTDGVAHARRSGPRAAGTGEERRQKKKLKKSGAAGWLARFLLHRGGRGRGRVETGKAGPVRDRGVRAPRYGRFAGSVVSYGPPRAGTTGAEKCRPGIRLRLSWLDEIIYSISNLEKDVICR
jgi:hypothetical protein